MTDPLRRLAAPLALIVSLAVAAPVPAQDTAARGAAGGGGGAAGRPAAGGGDDAARAGAAGRRARARGDGGGGGARGADGTPEAEIAYVAYTAPGADPATRPVTFAVNGGPGAASAYLNIGAIGPWRLPMDAERTGAVAGR